jgi:outer membrane protein OmpA-like peptidoglycan-associated protein
MEAKNMGQPLNNAGPNFISSITPDGNSMVVLLGNEYKGTDKDKMKPGVSISTKTSEGWAEPTAVDITNAYIESTDGNYFLAQNRKVMIMAVDRYDTHGGKDLYVSFLQENGNWTEPLNLGNDINTAHDETSPFLAADDETLYFSSKGFSGFGGSDIYISRRLDATWRNWTEPENLGRDINSSEDDMFFNIPPSGTYAYFSKGSGEDDADLYRIEMPVFYQPSPVVTVSGKILNAENSEPVEAKISYELMPEEKQVGLTLSDAQSGSYQIVLPSGASYQYMVEAPGYETVTESIDLMELANYKEISKDIKLTPSGEVASSDTNSKDVSGGSGTTGAVAGSTTAGKAAVLENNILFDFNADDVKASFRDELDAVAAFLKENPKITIDVKGHTDNVGNTDYNLRLSQRRAKSVYDYLRSKGVNEDQMAVGAYGENDPLRPNENEDARAINRRVSFSIKE